jgi:hypothetical protein
VFFKLVRIVLNAAAMKTPLLLALALLGGCSQQPITGSTDGSTDGNLAPDLSGPPLQCASSDGGASSCAAGPENDRTQCSAGQVADFCSMSGPCASYADQVAALRQPGACAPPSLPAGPSSYAEVRIGVCGPYQLIEVQGWGIGSRTLRFYDASGALVAAQIGSDTTEFCSSSSASENFGPVPACTPTVCEEICHAQGWIC